MTWRLTLRLVPASVARIFSGLSGCPGSLDTQRILLARLGSGGACSGSLTAHRIATISPSVPRTCGCGAAGALNPARAQLGSGLTSRCPGQPPPEAAAWPPEAAAAGERLAAGCPPPGQPAGRGAARGIGG